MNEQFIANVTYNNNKSLEEFDQIGEITKKFYDVPRVPLTIEETYVLRGALMNLKVLAEMTRNDLIRHEQLPVKKTFLQKLLRK